jgi:tRNA A-37 threonylcarbamoyl transferase component Bud32
MSCLACGAPVVEVDQPCRACGLPPVVGGRFRLQRKLGQGGMGTVYLARNESLGSQVAVKFLAPHLARDEGLAERFRLEGRVSVQVAHPGAVQLLDAGKQGEQLYLVFEYAEGEDLRAVLEREHTLAVKDAIHIAVKVAEVLAAAHAKGIVHRDIKPENLRVRSDLSGFQVKVLDFGIARLLDGPRLTAEGSASGTPTYMAPELVQAQAIDGRTDLYALGLVFYEMLAGHPAFSGNISQVFYKQLSQPTPTLGVAAIDAVIGRATAKAAGDRYPDATSFARALQSLDGEQGPRQPQVSSPTAPTFVALATPGPAPVAAPVRATPAPPPARSWALPLSAVGLVLLGVGGLVAWRGSGAVTTTAVASACPGIDFYDASLTSLSDAELERRARESKIMAPSMAARQLELLKASLANFAPEKRPCNWRLMLVGSLASERTVLRTEPSMWGQLHTDDELRELFLKTPLKQPWSEAERRAILGKIDSIFVANLKKDDPRDEGYWRRMYIGLELLCEATDEALQRFESHRPSSCLNLSP